jgi:hypothetical protein
MGKLELIKMSCPSCGAELNDFAGKDQISCEYCNAKCKVINPNAVDLEKYKTGFTGDNYDKFKNITAIIESSMQAENYNEAYNYCNKALELNPKVGEIWENKAICSFWKAISLFNEDKIVYSNAKEIVTFLNASKEHDKGSETYDVSADGIGFNLGHICLLRAALVRPDVADGQGNMTGFSMRNLNRIKDYMDTAETAFDIMVNKETEFLKICVNEYSNQSKAVWIKKQKDQLVNASALTFDPVKKREVLINKIKKYEPNYTPPEVKSFAPNIGLVIGIAVVAFIIFFAIFSSTL